jgi:uncharacterized protein YydD (DUF2326 family)
MRLTKEREQEIRLLLQKNLDFGLENNIELCQEVADIQILLSEIGTLRSENQKLRERIEKLRGALNLFGHVGDDRDCCLDCEVRIDALAQDDEGEKKE